MAKVARTYKDSEGLVHDVHVARIYSATRRAYVGYENRLTCTRENLYDLKVETRKRRVVSCLACIAAPEP